MNDGPSIFDLHDAGCLSTKGWFFFGLSKITDGRRRARQCPPMNGAPRARELRERHAFSMPSVGPEGEVASAAAQSSRRSALWREQRNHSSQVAGQGLPFFTALYDIEREAAALDTDERQRLRQRRAKPVCDALYE
ncbi:MULTISPECIES: hypothetical protein [Burkholderia cepacia complex]|uniref:hypothetical protein n=1 Tax=Burkholderia cepacia complex TaxID=87882 RepID=UPI003B27D62D